MTLLTDGLHGAWTSAPETGDEAGSLPDGGTLSGGTLLEPVTLSSTVTAVAP